MSGRFFFAALGAVTLSACASFDGAQEPVIKADAVANLVAGSYDLDTALKGIKGDPDKAAYRNRVLSIWLMAIDGRYDTFRRDLSRGRKGSSVGLDVLTLGLTAGGSVINGAAEELAAAATGLGGARASIDRELYFEKALPVLVTYMEAERLRERGRIIQGMGRKIEEYSLEQGFADLWRYQSAGSLDRALGQAAKDAGDRSENAEYDYSLAVDLCLPEADASAQRRVLGQRLLADLNSADATKKQTALAALKKAAELGGIQAVDAADLEKQKTAALAQLRALCTASELGNFQTAVFGGGN